VSVLRCCCVGLMLVVGHGAPAAELDVAGYFDLRLTNGNHEPNWNQGGLGKLRWGANRNTAQFGGAALFATAQLSPEWQGRATIKVQSDDRANLDILDASVRYRPVSTTPWRWSLRLGSFFPEISLENVGVGWTSPYTLTPSAINSWVGEELRSNGAEVRVEHRGTDLSIEGALALFAGNDPAGEQLANRGWSMSDLVYGHASHLREPDVSAFDAPPPRVFDPFVEIDHRIGWHAQLNLRSAHLGRWSLMRYDNRADPTTETHFNAHAIYSWRTRFWSLGGQSEFGRWTLTAQSMVGDTAFAPSPFFHSSTDFWSGFLLAARAQGIWRPALRLDWFGTRQFPETLQDPVKEHGRALTGALTWRPQQWPWLRVTGEVLGIDSARTQRRLQGRTERERDMQLQLAVRVFF
jgi:hypothetical protein